MPQNKGFASKAQMKKLALMVKQGKFPKKKFDQWAAETPDIKKLPNRVKPKKVKKAKKSFKLPITNKNYKKVLGKPK